jgi:hypothetical protein
MVGRLVLIAGAAAVFGVNGSAAAPQPTVTQIKAAIAAHSDNFILANAYAVNGHSPGHGFIDLETGAGRWLLPNGKLASLRTVTAVAHDPTHVIVSDMNIDYRTRTWYRTSRKETTKMAHPVIVDPLTSSPEGVRFRLLGVENVDGRQTYHLRSTTYFRYLANESVRLDVWFSTDHDYLIRFTHTTRSGNVVQRIDNRWLPPTPANLALLKATIPTGFKQVFVSGG